MFNAKFVAGSLAAAVLALATGGAAIASPEETLALAGDWSGVMPIQPPQHLILHVRKSGESVQATLDSPERGVVGVPVPEVHRDGSKVGFAIPAARVRYEGALDPDGHTLRGVLTQGDAPPLPLILTLQAGGEPVSAIPGAALAAWRAPSVPEVRIALRARVAPGRGVGVVVGVLRPRGGAEIIAEGVRDAADPRPVDGATVFRIDSVSKVLTGLLLADMSARNEVSLDDPVQRRLPASVRVPSRDGRAITLLDLATHTSGLPATPPDFDNRDGSSYGIDRLDRFVSGFQLTAAPGTRWTYSNVGVALLGQALAQTGHADFAVLVRDRITGPLGMTSTAATPSADIAARLAPGHDFAMRRMAIEPPDALAPAWGYYSSADDLLRLLRVQLGDGPAALTHAADLTLRTRRPIAPNAWQGVGWEAHEVRPGGPVVVFKNGGSRGYRSFIGFRPDTREGVVVLENALSAWSPDDLGLFVLVGQPLPALPASAPTAEHRIISLAPEILQVYVGNYQLTPQVQVLISAEAGHLYGQLTGRPRVELFPETPT